MLTLSAAEVERLLPCPTPSRLSAKRIKWRAKASFARRCARFSRLSAESSCSCPPSTSLRPLFPENAVSSGCTLSCIGNFSPSGTELPTELFKRFSRVYYDSRAAMEAEAGEILLARQAGFLSDDKIAGSLQEPARQNSHEILVFKSVGIAAQDLLAAKYVYERATSRAL